MGLVYSSDNLVNVDTIDEVNNSLYNIELANYESNLIEKSNLKNWHFYFGNRLGNKLIFSRNQVESLYDISRKVVLAESFNKFKENMLKEHKSESDESVEKNPLENISENNEETSWYSYALSYFYNEETENDKITEEKSTPIEHVKILNFIGQVTNHNIQTSFEHLKKVNTSNSKNFALHNNFKKVKIEEHKGRKIKSNKKTNCKHN